jgi:hypothetical protein
VHAVGHSLGARVILRAMATARAGELDRVILLAPAEFASLADAAMRSPCGRAAQVLTVTSRENDLFEFGLELAITAPVSGDRCLGHDGLASPSAVTLQLDHTGSLAALARAGYRIAPPRFVICHWSVYLRPGVFALYRAFLNGAEDAQSLRALLPAQRPGRWSRLRPALPPLRPRAAEPSGRWQALRGGLWAGRISPR